MMIDFERELIKSPKFYGKSSAGDLEEEYLTQEYDGYTLHRGEHWCSYRLTGVGIATQGWKIHISASPEDFYGVLDATLRVILEHRLHFKVVNTRDLYFLANSKNAGRESAGKLFTIYPNEHEFEYVVNSLARELEGFDGPEVLTDLPGPVPCLHFRYGAFVPIRNEDGEYCLYDERGELVVDRRDILEPSEVLARYGGQGVPVIEDSIGRLEGGDSVDVSEVSLVKQSNAGGIFRCKFEERSAFLKIGRRFAGLDRSLKDGAVRVLHESEQLKRLSSTGLTPKVLLQDHLRRDIILITEDLGCLDLHQFKKARFPLYLSSNSEWEVYLEDVLTISKRLQERIRQLHEESVYHRDLHGRNILTDGVEVYFVDLEESANAFDAPPGVSKAQGFANPLIRDAREADWFAFRQIIQELVFGNTRVNQFNTSGWDRRWEDPYESMRGSVRIERLLEQLKDLARVESLLADEGLLPNPRIDELAPVTMEQICGRIRLDVISCIDETGTISVSPDRQMDRFGYCWGFEYLKERFQADWDLSILVPKFRAHRANSLTLRNEVVHEKLTSALSSGDPLPSRLWDSEVLQLLLLERMSRERPHLEPVIHDWIMKISRQIRDVEFGKPLQVNSNLPTDQRTGLFYGPLGIAWILALWLREIPAVDRPIVLDAIRYVISAELEKYELNGSGALFAVQGTRLLPYLSTGSAGFGLVLPLLKEEFSQEWMREEAGKLLRAVDTEFSVCSGLFNGMIGLVAGVAGLAISWVSHFLCGNLYRGSADYFRMMQQGIFSWTTLHFAMSSMLLKVLVESYSCKLCLNA